MIQTAPASSAATPAMQEKWWRVLREGEISPFKIITVIFIRESYIHIELRRGSPEERCANLKFIYQLIQSNNVPFYEFKRMLEDPKHCVRPEILKRFNKVLQNLEEVNASFFYELVHSIIDVETSMSQMHILRKRISRTSPFGKFLRIVLLNLRKMSYPQALHLYQQLWAYLQPYIEFKKTIHGKSSSGASKDKDAESSKIKMDIPITPVIVKKEVEDYQENIPLTSTAPPAMETAEIPTQPVNTSTAAASVPLVTPSTSKSAAAKVEKKRKQGLDIFFNMVRNRRKNDFRGMNLSVRSTYEYERKKNRKILTPEEDAAYQEELKKKKERVNLALERVKNLRSSWYPISMQEPEPRINRPSSDFGMQSKRSRVKPSPKKGMVGKSPRKYKVVPNETDIIVEADSDYFFSDDESGNDRDYISAPTKRGSRFASSSSFQKSSTEKDTKPNKLELSLGKTTSELNALSLVPGSKRWKDVKYWSRKQIEKTIKLLTAELYRVGSRKYTPAHITAFVESIKHNPSALALLPQLHFLEYLNSLRLKDLVRCKESLRTSFDLRIKPNTSELNKGTPYAAYNFAVFYNLMGFRKDAMQFLEEAFQAGHSAADTTCLHYCHNLWSIFHSKPYKDVALNCGKETYKHMAYLQSLNVVTCAYDNHYQGFPPEDVIFGLLHGSVCDMQLIEHIRLLALSFFFSSTGWHNMIAFACQCILYSHIPWTSMAYCASLCVLAQNVLFEGDVPLAVAMMEYGEKLFALEWTPAGELFSAQRSLFSALVMYLAHQPVPEETIAAIGAIDKAEEYYWKAYNKMIQTDWGEAEKLLKSLRRMKIVTSDEKNELYLRSLVLRAELSCLCGKPTGALEFLFEALKFATRTYSDHYIALCLIHIASIQCELGMVKLASGTLYQEFRSHCRSSSPVLTARFNIINVKLRVATKSTLGPRKLKSYLMLLEEAENIYSLWNNEYRLKEVKYWKSRLLDSTDSEMVVDDPSFSEYHVMFSPSTCIM